MTRRVNPPRPDRVSRDPLHAGAADVVRHNELLRGEIAALRAERDKLRTRIRELEKGLVMDQATRRAALNLMEDAVEARRAGQRENEERRRAEEELRQADRRKDEFLALLAHELRNPLAPIRNAVHIMRLAMPHDAGIERVGEMMERQVSHMVRLVDDLLEISRITRGKIELRKEQVDIAPIVFAAIDTSRPLIESARHHLTVAMSQETLTVIGDPVRLTQVLSNLLNNAAKYTDPEGEITLSVRCEGTQVAISVRDTGVGIPADKLPRVFDLFMQVEHRNHRSQGGLGIGLTLVKSLVEMHGGTIRATSEGMGRGSEFVLMLPLATNVSLRRAVPGDTASRAASQRVLVVDDNRDAADSLAILLEMLGNAVHVEYSGPAALEALNVHRPRVVLLDLGMPGMDGYEVAQRIREDPAYRDVMLVALTGWGQEADRIRAKAAGFDHHLVKPADIEALNSLLVSLESGAASNGGAQG